MDVLTTAHEHLFVHFSYLHERAKVFWMIKRCMQRKWSKQFAIIRHCLCFFFFFRLLVIPARGCWWSNFAIYIFQRNTFFFIWLTTFYTFALPYRVKPKRRHVDDVCYVVVCFIYTTECHKIWCGKVHVHISNGFALLFCTSIHLHARNMIYLSSQKFTLLARIQFARRADVLSAHSVSVHRKQNIGFCFDLK